MLVLKMLMLILTASLSYTPTTEKFLIGFTKGAVEVCIDYKSLTETIVLDGKEGPYTPRKCYYGTETMTQFEENWAFIEANNGDWEVTATAEYMNPDGTVRAVASNTVIARH